MINIDSLRQTLNAMRDSIGQPTLSSSLSSILRDIPRKPEYLDLFEQGLDLINRIDDPSAHRNALLDFVKEIPRTYPFEPLYLKAMEAVIIAADAVKEGQYRINELLRIAREPQT